MQTRRDTLEGKTNLRTDDGTGARMGIALLVGLVALAAGCDGPLFTPKSEDANQPQLTKEERRQLEGEVDEAKSGSRGLVLYRSSYQNMSLVGRAEGRRFAFVAGTHDPNFPFFADKPWDNGLLLVGDEKYHFNHREQGRALSIEIPMGRGSGEGRVRYDGTMTRVSDGADVSISLDIPLSFRRYAPLSLAWPLDFLDGQAAANSAGMRWQPFELESNRGHVTLEDGTRYSVGGLNGEIEYGTLSNLQAPQFAFTYSYVNVAAAGDDGYAFVDFSANAIDGGKLGEVLNWWMERTATATVTLDDGFVEKNAHEVDRPAQSDPTVVMFENEVDLGLAVLKRQMIETTDADGNRLYGLREVFVPK